MGAMRGLFIILACALALYTTVCVERLRSRVKAFKRAGWVANWGVKKAPIRGGGHKVVPVPAAEL